MSKPGAGMTSVDPCGTVTLPLRPSQIQLERSLMIPYSKTSSFSRAST